jgi:hypothetical protein
MQTTNLPRRKTLQDIPYYPNPKELYDDLMRSAGWEYKINQEKFLQRDRALFALLYLAELRISEAIRLVSDQFERQEKFVYIKAILLSKRKPGKIKYRDARLPLEGPRAKFTEIIMSYVDTLKPEQRLFPWSLTENRYPINEYTTRAGITKTRYSVRITGTARAWKIINALAEGKLTEHWLRAYGYNFLYDEWKHDILAVADSSKTDPRTLSKYIRRRHEQYPAT